MDKEYERENENDPMKRRVSEILSYIWGTTHVFLKFRD